MFKRCLTSVALLVMMAGQASAQKVTSGSMIERSKTKGFMVGPHLQAGAIESEGMNTESGGGVGLVAAYGFSQHLALYTALDFASVESEDPTFPGDYGLTHFDLGLRINLRNQMKKTRPYINVAVTGRAAGGTVEMIDPGSNATVTGDYMYSGAGVTVGGGVAIFTSRKGAIDIGLVWTGGDFTDFEFEGEPLSSASFQSTTTRFTIGYNFHF